MKSIRNSVKAIIISDGRLLVTCNAQGDIQWHLLPGGGQRHGETAREALVRECREEIGAHVIVGHLVLVREYIAANHEFAEDDGDVHQVELMFECTVDACYVAQNGHDVDIYQTGVTWLPITELNLHPLYPQALKSVLQTPLASLEVRYLGDVN